MKNNILVILICFASFSCIKHTEIRKNTLKEKKYDNSLTERIKDNAKGLLFFGIVLQGYQPRYLEENKFKIKAIKVNKRDYFTTEGMNVQMELAGLISQAEHSTDDELDAINSMIQQKLAQTTKLPDYQRLVTGTATRFMGKRLLRPASNTPKEKELILFYTRSFIEQQGTNYYLVYTALKRLEGYATPEEIKSLAQQTIAFYTPLDVSANVASAQGYEKIFYNKIIEGERYNQSYRIKLKEFL